MKTIYKFNVGVDDKVEVAMPLGAKILTVGVQDQRFADLFVLWAEVDPEQPVEERHFSIYGTGRALPEDPGQYVGTALCAGGSLVWHVYEEAS